MKRAQLEAEAVSVLCPHCGGSQPNHEGSEMWIAEDFARKNGVVKCVACDEPMLITHDSKVQFTVHPDIARKAELDGVRRKAEKEFPPKKGGRK